MKFPLSPMSYYGNLLPYLDSYYYARRDEISLHVDSLWPASIYRCTLTLSMIFTSPMELRFGIHRCIMAGLLLLWLSILACFIAVREPLALVLTFGAIQGTANGILYPTTLKLLLQAIPNKAGLVAGLLDTGPMFGALVNIGLSFLVINPSNKKPDLHVNNAILFSDPSILQRVPYFFLVKGTFMVAYTLIGLMLAFCGSSDLASPKTEQMSEETALASTKLHERNGDIKIKVLESQRKETKPVKNGDVGNFKSLFNLEKQTFQCKASKYDSVLYLSNGDVSSNREKQKKDDSQSRENCTKLIVQAELSPLETLRTWRFWCVWLCYFCIAHTYYLHTNLYKQYGQLVIPNDLMLVTTGVISMLCTIMMRPYIGIFSDKYGIRNTALAVSAFSSLSMSFMVISHYKCSWVYAIPVVMEFISISPQTMVFSLFSTFEFGKTHCATNFGLISSGNILVMLSEPFIASTLIRTIGWDWLFLTGSMTATVSMVSVMIVGWLRYNRTLEKDSSV
ncbi:hypothetical protein RRG08_018925 [Elysia crispata]|uniref:Major facilitator superfamily (MFS) profile domain-containing protein n=1 Tax=Elysia crispata TaxID=231223 RepID=A0AAE1AYW8_9GAST|nr:hypothetical protein RRG08_018925 [Elysia crispata]